MIHYFIVITKERVKYCNLFPLFMELSNIVTKLSENHNRFSKRAGHLYYSSLAFLTINGLDMISTSLCMNKYGIEDEHNPIAPYLVEKFGINEGLVIGKMITIPIAIGLGYLIYRLGKDYENKLVRNLGSLGIYGLTALGVPIVTNNFMGYFH